MNRLDMLEQMIAKGSTDPFVHYARALELRAAGRFDEALAALIEVSERFANYLPTYLMAGQIATDLGREDVARALLSRGVELARETGDGHALSELEGALRAVEL